MGIEILKKKTWLLLDGFCFLKNYLQSVSKVFEAVAVLVRFWLKCSKCFLLFDRLFTQKSFYFFQIVYMIGS